MSFKFENLKVWEKAVDLSSDISVLVKAFPKDGLYVLTRHIKRTTDSISLNIAEGSTGQPTPEFKKFLGYSLRYVIEIVECLHLAKRRMLINSGEFDLYYEKLTFLVIRNTSIKKFFKMTVDIEWFTNWTANYRPLTIDY